MADIILFHSVLGLRPLERDLAERWRAASHSVALPDLYAGASTDDYDEGFALRGDHGDDVIADRARAALAGVPDSAVLAGVSMGNGVLARFWSERPRAAGALCLCGMPPPVAPPPEGLRIASHVAQPDPFDTDAEIAEWAADLDPRARLELHRYPDCGHLFLDPVLADYDVASAELCHARCLEFLASL